MAEFSCRQLLLAHASVCLGPHARTLALKGFPDALDRLGRLTAIVCIELYPFAGHRVLHLSCRSLTGGFNLGTKYHPFHRWPFADVLAIHSPLRCIVHRKNWSRTSAAAILVRTESHLSSHDVHIPLGLHK
jgi:hypothetical protein